MNDMFNFHRFDPFTIGFTDVFEELEKTSKQIQKAASYPPYNIKQVSDNKYVIEMAVAGLEGNKLVVKGTSNDESAPENFIFKGIKNSNFTREFTIADKVEVENAELVNGMLKIGLSNMVKMQDAIKKIPLFSKE